MTKGEPVPFEPGNVSENTLKVGEGEGEAPADISAMYVPLAGPEDVPIT